MSLCLALVGLHLALYDLFYMTDNDKQTGESPAEDQENAPWLEHAKYKENLTDLSL